MAGVFAGAILLVITLSIPPANQGLFLIMLALTGLVIPFSAPNVISTVHDVSLPEVRSSALSIQYFIESAGAALAPLIAGLIADRSSLQTAILAICVSAWLLCGLVYAFVARYVPHDIETVRSQLRDRAERERALATGEPAAA
jgi:MFS family permease